MATAPVRPGRSRGLVIAVTGAASPPGRALALRLAGHAARAAGPTGLARTADSADSAESMGSAGGEPGATGLIRKVVAIDDHRGDVPGVTWRVVDIRDPLLSNRISDVDTIVHLDIDESPGSDPRARRAHNISGAQSVLTAAAAARVGHVVIVTSAIVNAARPDNPVPLPEDAPPPPAGGDPGIAGDHAEIERLTADMAAAHPALTFTVVRPAVLAGPGVDTVAGRQFAAPRLIGLKGTEPPRQFCHVDDLASGLEQIVLARMPGTIAVGSDGWLAPDEVAEITGLPRLDLPAPVVFGLAHRLHRLGLTPAPSLELRYAVHPWVVDCATLRAAGWKPAYDNASALRALINDLAERGIGADHWAPPSRKAAMATAAGATTAMIVTAAVVRARRRRGRR